MTDKQIIIDGVDVSGCEWFYKNDPCKNTCKYFCTPCEWVEIQKCMYKYAKRKEQECEELKKRISNYKCPMDNNADYCGHLEDYGELLGQLYQLKAENDELKKDNLQEVGQLKFAIGTLTAENLHLKELLDMRIEALCDSCKAGSMLPIKCRIYEKTLTEIKEIIHFNKTNRLSGGADISIEQILQKISEVENG